MSGVLVALFTIPATAYELKAPAQLAAPTTNNPNFITRDEQSALRYLARSAAPGGVLTRNYLVLSDCQTTANLPKLLGPLISATRKFGCASVYTVA